MATETKQVTVELDAKLLDRLQRRSADTERSLSQLINEAVQLSLSDDVEDLAAFDERADEPNLDFDTVVQDLKQRDKL